MCNVQCALGDAHCCSLSVTDCISCRDGADRDEARLLKETHLWLPRCSYPFLLKRTLPIGWGKFHFIAREAKYSKQT